MFQTTGKGFGCNMAHAYRFAILYPNWHTMAKNRATRDAIKRLVARNVVETNEFGQFRATCYDY